MDNEKILDISWGTIIKIGAAIIFFYILYLIKDILVWVVFALIISFLFNPAINFLKKRHIPTVISVVIVYIFFFGALGLFIYIMAPLFVSEIQQFSQFFPQYFEKIAPSLRGLGIEAFKSLEVFTQSLQGWLIKASASIFGALSAIFGGIMATFTIFVLALFFSLEEEDIEKVIKIFSPKRYENYVLSLWKSCQNKVSVWFGTKILGCIFLGITSFIALLVFKIDYAFALSILAGVTNLVPLFGPIIAGAIMAIFAAFDSWLKAIFIIIVFIFIQQIESNILSPLLTKKFIGLSPVLVLIALMIGGKLWGLLGAVLAIPLTGVIFEFLRDFLKKRKEEQETVS